METQVPADQGTAPAPAGRDAIEQRLAAIEGRLAALETSLRDTVTQELQGAGEEMRRAVSELGRLLLRDLDRLTKVLAEHRDAIVERLSRVPEPDSGERSLADAEAAGAAGAADAGWTAEAADAADAGVRTDVRAAPQPGAGEAGPRRGEEGRWWAFPTRRSSRRPGRRRLRR